MTQRIIRSRVWYDRISGYWWASPPYPFGWLLVGRSGIGSTPEEAQADRVEKWGRARVPDQYLETKVDP